MSHTKNKEARREFLKSTGIAVLAAVPLATGLTELLLDQAQAQPATAGPLVMIKPTDPQAAALGYVEDAHKVDIKKFPKRAGPDGAKQFCWACIFYQAKTANPKDSPTAACQILSNKGVKAGGWCNTWTQNPKVKV